MGYITEEERQLELKKLQDKQYKIGKVIVLIIATYNIIGAIVSTFVEFNIFSLVLSIAISIALYCGVVWVKYFYALASIMSVFGTLGFLRGIEMNSGDNTIGIVFIMTCMVANVLSSIVLFASKSVTKFLYKQKNR